MDDPDEANRLGRLANLVFRSAILTTIGLWSARGANGLRFCGGVAVEQGAGSTELLDFHESAARLPPHTNSEPHMRVGTNLLIVIKLIEESTLRTGQRLPRALAGLAFLCISSAFAAQPAHADGSVSSLGMGYGARNQAIFAQFLAVIQQYNASGERFRIDGHCQSACTMFLSIRNVCVTPDATLLFHAGGNMQKGIINPSTTQKMLSTYNAALRRYVTENHFMDTFAFHPVSGSEIIRRFGYRACR